MLNFIQVDDGSYIAVREITRMVPQRERLDDGSDKKKKDFRHYVAIFTRDGDRYEASYGSAGLDDLNTYVVPAQPGAVLLDYQVSAEEIYIFRHDILAWKINHDNMWIAEPIISDEKVQNASYAILQSNGSVVRPFSGTFDNYEAFMQSLREEQKQLQPSAA